MELQQHIQNQMCHCFKAYFADLVEATDMYAARTYFWRMGSSLVSSLTSHESWLLEWRSSKHNWRKAQGSSQFCAWNLLVGDGGS